MAEENKKFIGVYIDENNQPLKEEPFIGWHSRSMGVCIILTNHEHTRFLLELRGPGCPDFINKWCCPCGYLGWSETLKEAAAREIYEETGFTINPDILKFWEINDDPKENRQNVTARYYAEVFDDELDRIVEKKMLDSQSRGGENNEVADLKVFNINDIAKNKDQFAFNHYNVLVNFIVFMKSKTEQK